VAYSVFHEPELHSAQSQRATFIDTAVKTSQKKVCFDLYGEANSVSTVTQLWNPITLRNLEDGVNTSSETSVRTKPTLYKFPEGTIIDTAVKASQTTVFFNLTQYPSMERLINSDSTVTQLWNPITLRNPEDGGDTFSETSVRTRAIRYKIPEGILMPVESSQLHPYVR
jgi:hypothetical protein